MSDNSPPPKPKPGSLRDRIAAFEQQKPTSAPGPPIAPRPKPGGLSQWKPRPSSPHDAQPATNRNDASMSASDAKESITKGGSLKERMAALQGLGAFGGGPPAAPPPRPAEKPKWKPPPQVAVAPPVAGDEGEDGSVAADDRPPISPLKAPSDDILVALSKAPPPPPQEPPQEKVSEIEGEAPAGGDDAPDPEEEERQRRAAIAARMARLGGARVGMAPPIFGRKPEVKPKPPMPAPETTQEAQVAEPQSRSERDVEQAQTETGIAANVPLPTSPPTDETATETPSPQPQVSPSENVPQHPQASESPNVPPRSMPIPQAPRRAAPPRKKSSQKQTPPTETEATTLSPEKDTPIPDVSDPISESQMAPILVTGHVEPEVDVAAGPTADVYSAGPADEDLQPTDQTFGVASQLVPTREAGSGPALPSVPPPPPLVPHSKSPDELEVESSPVQSLQFPDNVGESAVPSVPTVSQTTQEETEAERVVAPEPDEYDAFVEERGEDDEDETARKQHIAERVANMGGINPLGGQPIRSPSLGDEPPHVERKLSGGEVPVENEGITPQDQPAAAAQTTPPIPYSVFQQGGSATGVNEDGDGDDDDDGYDGKY